MPLVWQRNYDSGNPREGLLGQGWTLLADAHLLIRPDKTLYIEPNGREFEFAPPLEIGETDLRVVEQLTLSRDDSHTRATDRDGRVTVFHCDAD